MHDVPAKPPDTMSKMAMASSAELVQLLPQSQLPLESQLSVNKAVSDSAISLTVWTIHMMQRRKHVDSDLTYHVPATAAKAS